MRRSELLLGIAGLRGAGRTELVRAIFGADPRDSGKVLIKGRESQVNAPRKAVEIGIGLVPKIEAARAVLAPVFFNIQNILNVARQASVAGVVAVGMTFVILTGGIDLSVGAILAVVGVCFAMMIKQSVPIPLAMIIAMLIGVVIGLCNGIGIIFFGIQAAC